MFKYLKENMNNDKNDGKKYVKCNNYNWKFNT